MRSKGSRSLKDPSRKSKTPQFRILSRPSSPDRISLQNTTDLSEFETPSKQLVIDPNRHLSSVDARPSVVDSKDATGASPRPQSMPATNFHGHFQDMPSTVERTTDETDLAASPKPKIPVPASHTHYRSMPSALENITNNTAPLTPSTTPKKANSPPLLQTPLRLSVTPARFYAGPAFHASPAASTLPIPKTFSKSVPDLQNNSCLMSMMENEEKKLDSDQNNESPSLRKSIMAKENKVNEEPHLDISFPAIKSEKFSQQFVNTAPVSSENSTGLSWDEYSKRNPSSTTYKGPTSCHARHDTEGSMGGLFPLDLDDSSLPATPKADNFSESSALHLHTPPIPLDDEERNLKSLELKRLLFLSAPPSSFGAAPENPVGLGWKPPDPTLSRSRSPQDPSTSASVLSSKSANTPQKQQQRAISSSVSVSPNGLLNSESKPSNPPKLQQRAISSSSTSPSLNPRPKRHNPKNPKQRAISSLSASPPLNPSPKSFDLHTRPGLSFISNHNDAPKHAASTTPICWYSADISTILPFTPRLSSETPSHSIQSKIICNPKQMNSTETYLRDGLRFESRNGANGIQTWASLHPRIRTMAFILKFREFNATHERHLATKVLRMESSVVLVSGRGFRLSWLYVLCLPYLFIWDLLVSYLYIDIGITILV